jgi:TIR domain-containing protein
VRRAQQWVRHVLHPPLVDFLALNAGISPDRVFLDDRKVRPGMEVETTVHEALRDSRVLLAVLSPQYFESGWCLTEFHTMLARQQTTGQRVVYPLAVWDGDKYPPEARALAPLDYNKWGTLERGMPRKRWNDTVVVLVKELEGLVHGSPAHDPGWTVALHNDPAEPHVDRQGY